MILISVHLPKTAGTSFGSSLEDYFGTSLLKDYDNNNNGISREAYDRNKITLLSSIDIAENGLESVKCIHGHFLPVKYMLLGTRKKLSFITWFRQPVERMISHYNFWQRSYDPILSEGHHKQVVEEEWTLEQFCLSPRFRNIYSQYLWCFPFEYFSFIGITEYYEQDIQYFSEKILRNPIECKYLNSANNQKTKEELAPSLLKKIKQYHAEDILLYEKALKLRLTRSYNRIDESFR